MKLIDKKVRKTISISSKINDDLIRMAEFYNKPQSALIEELLKEKLKEYKKQVKKNALKKIIKNADYFKGVTENKTIKELKREQGNEY